MAVSFYRNSFGSAKSDNCEELYYMSKAENFRCKKYIEDTFHKDAYVDNRVDSDGEYTRNLIEEFGMERVMNIYAITLRKSINDGRISPEMKEWAKTFNAGYREGEDLSDSHLTQINIGVVDILAKKAVAEYNKLGLFTSEHCHEKLGDDLTGKVVVISPKYLKEEYWSPENQLWLATGGFGCSPTASGSVIFSTCLIDDDENEWRRSHVIGALKDEYLPEWAREKINEIYNSVSEEEDIGMEFN